MSEASVKLLSRGVETLTDQELLELLLDDGDSERLAGALLSSFEGRLAALGYADIARLRMAAGIGLKRAARIQAAVELGRRVLAARELGPDPIGSSNDVVRIFRPLLTEMKHEECWCLYLNTGNRIVERQRVSQGGVQATVVDHRLVIKRALELLATQIILVHNHPSGAALPSEQDKILTKKIAEAAALFDIRLLDHLIIARGGEYSSDRAVCCNSSGCDEAVCQIPEIESCPCRSLSGRGENIKIGRVRQLFVLPLRSIVAQVVGRKRRDHRNGACDSLIVAGRVGCGLSSSGFTLFCRRKVFLPKGERKFRLPGNFCRSVPYFFFEEEHKVNLFSNDRKL